MSSGKRAARSAALLLIACAVCLMASVAHAADSSDADANADPFAWPQATRDARPWTRWWWLGSAVDEPNLTRLLGEYSKAGFGGVEICPIYGAKGHEGRYVEFLSPRWMEVLAHTTAEAKRLGMGVDMTTGTGWPFGGPWVSAEEASSGVVLKAYDLQGGAALAERLPQGRLQHLAAVSDRGERIDLTSRVVDGRLGWTAPAGQKWRLYAILARGPVQKVKRAAPGGAGNVLDPYSVSALDKYLGRFDDAFADYRGDKPRGHFHDSFEYYGASWTPGVLTAFEQRRGYDLRSQLPALFGEGPEDAVARVRGDYRQTLADLHVDFVRHWTRWAHGHGGLSRNQAHGAPSNLIDLYGAADVPETEIFREVDERQIPLLKLATSAAHLTGGALASAESFTWFGEHFQSSLADLKAPADFLFLSGVNHLVYHGVPYSSQDAGWPGWLFYASTHLGPSGGLWRDLPAFNAYVARCQSVLQSGRPSNDVLLYFPQHDIWQTPGGELLMTFTVHNQEKWLWPQPFYQAAMALWQNGCGFDAISDHFLAGADVKDGSVTVGGDSYGAVVVPKTRFIPPATMRTLIDLASKGATIIAEAPLPSDVPGFADSAARRDELRRLLASAGLTPDSAAPPRDVPFGRGRFVLSPGFDGIPRRAAGFREPAVDLGLRFVRRTHPRGHSYFIVNPSDRPVDAWVPLATPAHSAVLLDPLFADRAGVAATRRGATGAAEVYLQLHPGQSLVLRTFTAAGPAGSAGPADAPDATPAGANAPSVISATATGTTGTGAGAAGPTASGPTVPCATAGGATAGGATAPVATPTGPPWRYTRPAGATRPVTGEWSVRFLDGGPALPQPFTTRDLASWTTLADPEAVRFAGTALYSLQFDHPPAGPGGGVARGSPAPDSPDPGVPAPSVRAPEPAAAPDDWLLDLGRVADSARVRINGKEVATLWSRPFQVHVGPFLRPGRNTLEVEVTNVAANRIADLDRRGVDWKRFHEINFVNRDYKPFDASRWPPRDAGLLGPVRLVPLAHLNPTAPADR